MKSFLAVLCLLVLAEQLPAQIDQKKGYVQAVAYWDKGNTARYHVVQERSEGLGADSRVVARSEYDVAFEVVEMTDKSYQLRWTYANIQVSATDPLVKSLATLVDGLTLEIRTDENGSFVELVNWQECSRQLNKALDLLETKLSGVDKIAMILRPVRALYSSKESIEQLAIKDVQQYLKFYGSRYQIDKEYRGHQSIANPLGSGELSETVLAKVETSEVDTEHDLFVVRQWATVDAADAKNAIIAFLKTLPPDAHGAPFKESELGDCLIEDRDAAQFEGASGWLDTSVSTRELTFAGKRRLDRTTIELQ